MVQLHPGEEHDAGRGERDAQPVPPAPAGDPGHRDGTEKFDGHRGTERQVLDRQVERHVHGGQHDPEHGRAGQVRARPGLPPGSPPRQ